MAPTHRLFAAFVALALFLSGLAAGIEITKNLLIVNWDAVAPGKLFSAAHPLDIPSLQTLTANAKTDDQALQAITDYFSINRAKLAQAFKETDPERLKALYAMYTIHVSHMYGVVKQRPTSFLEYLRQPYSDCGTSSEYQSLLLDRLGMAWRIIGISGDTHVFVETLINDNWEVFDSTVNVWVNTSAFEMERGAVRTSRTFYTPLLDEQRVGDADGNPLQAAQELRVMMPGLGVFFFPKAYLYIAQESQIDMTALVSRSY